MKILIFLKKHILNLVAGIVLVVFILTDDLGRGVIFYIFFLPIVLMGVLAALSRNSTLGVGNGIEANGEDKKMTQRELLKERGLFFSNTFFFGSFFMFFCLVYLFPCFLLCGGMW